MNRSSEFRGNETKTKEVFASLAQRSVTGLVRATPIRVIRPPVRGDAQRARNDLSGVIRPRYYAKGLGENLVAMCILDRRWPLPALRLKAFWLIALAAMLAAIIVSGTAPSYATATTAPVPMPDFARIVVKQVNVIRRANGLPWLTISARLTRAADAHARILAATGTFTHDWSDGRPFAVWIRSFYPAQGFRFWAAAENLLWATPSFVPRDGVREWLASPPHRRNLLAPQWRSIGIAVIKAEGTGGVFGGGPVEIAAAEFGVRSR